MSIEKLRDDASIVWRELTSGTVSFRICICAIAVLVSALHLPSNDEVSFNMKNTALFAHVEVNLSIVACKPDPSHSSPSLSRNLRYQP